ncbi:MAG: hypothetical protein U0271_15295 [Polyangiaceae bacterium]
MSPRTAPEFESEEELPIEDELLDVQEKTEQVEERLREQRVAPTEIEPKKPAPKEDHGAYRTASPTDAKLEEAQDRLVQLQIEEAVLRETATRQSRGRFRPWLRVGLLALYVASVVATGVWLGETFAAPVAILLPLGLLVFWALGKIDAAPASGQTYTEK